MYMDIFLLVCIVVFVYLYIKLIKNMHQQTKKVQNVDSSYICKTRDNTKEH
jgi:uncharacterized membrane protein